MAGHSARKIDRKNQLPDQGRYAEFTSRCLEHVPGWGRLRRNALVLKPMLGGLSNELFTCEADAPDLPITKVVIRVYGTAMSHLIDPKQERAVSRALAKEELGPAIYFESGDDWRIEQFFTGSPLNYKQLPSVADRLAQYMAKLHAHKMELEWSKSESQLFPRMRRWLDLALTAMAESKADETKSRLLGEMRFSRATLEAELAWLEEHLKPFGSPVVFCHNDLQEGNVIKDGHELQVIDFEYGCYNNRGFDLGNFFCEWLIDNQFSSPPFFRLDFSNFPTLEQRLHVAKSYLGATSETEAQKLEKEAYSYMLASHLLWVVWAVFQAFSPQVESNKFDYMQYAYDRWFEYQRQKRTLAAHPTAARL